MRNVDLREAYASMYENRMAAYTAGESEGKKMMKSKPAKVTGGKTYTMKGKDGKPLFKEEEQIDEIVGAVAPAIAGTVGAATGGKRKVKKAVGAGTGAAVGGALGGPVGSVLGGIAGGMVGGESAEYDGDGDQIDEAIPAIAAAAGKMAALGTKKAAMGGASKIGGRAAKMASSKMGQKAIGAGANKVGSMVQNKLSSEEIDWDSLDEGKKDACYHKVKSRYDVWPSAYASGALVKCRKAGASNWGNKSKKEEVEYEVDNSQESYTSAYMEGYKKFPAAKVQDKAAMKPDSAKGEKQARKMDKVRAVMTDDETGLGNAARQFNKRQPEANRKRRLEKNYKAPSHDKSLQAKKDKLEKAYKKEELEAVFAYLIGEGIAYNEQSAINILTHMSDEWYDSIVVSFISEA